MKKYLILCFLIHSNLLYADILIKNALINGDLPLKDIYIKGDKIHKIGTNLKEKNIEVIDAKGNILTSGLFAGINSIGLEEISAEKSTVESSYQLESKSNDNSLPKWYPEFDTSKAYNPRSTLIPIARNSGLTFSYMPHNNLIGMGNSYLLSKHSHKIMNSSNIYIDLFINQKSLIGNSKAFGHLLLENAIEETIHLNKSNTNDMLRLKGKQIFLKAMKSSIIGFKMDAAQDMEEIIKISKKYNFKIFFVGAAQATIIKEKLAKEKIPVFIDPIQNLPMSFDKLGSDLDNASILYKAGVNIAFYKNGDASHHARQMRFLAGNAVANGLPWIAGLEAITKNPAHILGLKNIGAVEVGYYADLVIWNGDPLDVSSWPLQMWIHGNEENLESRQTLLRDKYL